MLRPIPKRRTLTSRLTPTSPEHTVGVPATGDGGGHVRLRLDIAYDGTDFAGWAVQAGQRTVAGVLDEALSTVFRTPVRLRGAARTDTGVHAVGQVAHLDVPADASAARLSAVASEQLTPSSCAWCDVLAGSCPPTSRFAKSAAPQPVSTHGSRRCAATTCTGCRPRPTVCRRCRPATSRRGRTIWTSTR